MKTIWDLYKNNMRVETWIFFCRSSSWMLWELGQAEDSSQSDYSPESTNQRVFLQICPANFFVLNGNKKFLIQLLYHFFQSAHLKAALAINSCKGLLWKESTFRGLAQHLPLNVLNQLNANIMFLEGLRTFMNSFWNKENSN